MIANLQCGNSTPRVGRAVFYGRFSQSSLPEDAVLAWCRGYIWARCVLAMYLTKRARGLSARQIDLPADILSQWSGLGRCRLGEGRFRVGDPRQIETMRRANRAASGTVARVECVLHILRAQ